MTDSFATELSQLLYQAERLPLSNFNPANTPIILMPAWLTGM
ncbi:hypothetical protein [Corynebacterium freiburgense]|nr:hypothetical protein [Corynebacterium freiburgense]